jgi:hypothetical protein
VGASFFFVRHLEEEGLIDIIVDGKVILKYILKKQDTSKFDVIHLLSVETIVGFLWTWQVTSVGSRTVAD